MSFVEFWKKNEPFYWAPRIDEDGDWEGVSAEDWEKELAYLKSKIEAGGQVIITQLFYDVKIFIEFIKECRKHGIVCPILPGIMPIRNYDLFKRMTKFCRTVIPDDLNLNLKELKDKKEEFEEFGIKYIVTMCQQLLNTRINDNNNNGYLVPSIHIYTMNTEYESLVIIKECQLYDKKNPEIKKKTWWISRACSWTKKKRKTRKNKH